MWGGKGLEHAVAWSRWGDGEKLFLVVNQSMEDLE